MIEVQLNYVPCLLYFQKHYATITALRTGLPEKPARLHDPVLFNISRFQIFSISFTDIEEYCFVQRLT